MYASYQPLKSRTLRSRQVSAWCCVKAALVVAAGVACWWATIALVVPHLVVPH